MRHEKVSSGDWITILALTLFAGTVSAEGDGPSQSVDTLSISLTVDCSQTPDTPEAIEYLANHNLCGYGNPEGGVTSGTVVGNCGTLTLNLYDDSTPGWLHWQAIITSSLGPMFSAEYRGYAHNLNTGGGHVVIDSDSWIFSSYWQSDVPKYTGAGTIFGEIVYAKMTLLWGGVCYNAGIPTDVVQVT